MPKITKKDLEYFGEGLQYRFVKSLIEDPTTFSEIEGYISPDHFSDPGLQAIVKIMKSFYEEKGKTPGYRDLEYYLKEKVKTQDELNVAYKAYSQVKNEELLEGMGTAAEIGANYIKRQETPRQLENAKESIKNSGFAQERLDRAKSIWR